MAEHPDQALPGRNAPPRAARSTGWRSPAAAAAGRRPAPGCGARRSGRRRPGNRGRGCGCVRRPGSRLRPSSAALAPSRPAGAAVAGRPSRLWAARLASTSRSCGSKTRIATAISAITASRRPLASWAARRWLVEHPGERVGLAHQLAERVAAAVAAQAGGEVAFAQRARAGWPRCAAARPPAAAGRRRRPEWRRAAAPASRTRSCQRPRREVEQQPGEQQRGRRGRHREPPQPPFVGEGLAHRPRLEAVPLEAAVDALRDRPSAAAACDTLPAWRSSALRMRIRSTSSRLRSSSAGAAAGAAGRSPRSAARIRVSPASSTARSMAWASSRTLPGQGWASRASMASGAKPSNVLR